MHVGLVTGEYPPMEGGVGAFTREIARAMAAAGHTVSVFTRAAARGEPEPGIAVHAVVGSRWGWGASRAVRTWAQQSSIDVLNIQFETAAYDMHPAIHWLPGSVRSVPVVVTFHDLRVPYLFPRAGALRTRILQKLARSADGVISTDRADERVLRGWGISPVEWIPIGSNISAAPPGECDRARWRERLGAAPGDLLIAYFGFLNETKGGLVLIEALAQLVEQGIPARLVMIGGRAGASDPTNLAYGERVDAAIARHGLDDRVRWTGFVDDEGVSGCFYASDVTALPYLDGVSLRRGTLMAALAHGRAIVTTHPQTDAPELDGVVRTVPAGNPAALAAAILTVWQDGDLRARLEKAALEASQRFSWDGIAARTLEFYTRLCGGR
ncbi:MAG: glycosyltransferase family 4 protein [Anaerolineae bacterium]